MTNKLELNKAFQAADDAWSAELSFQFGRKAGDMRYTSAGQGLPGTKLSFLYAARDAARIAWEAVAFGVSPQ